MESSPPIPQLSRVANRSQADTWHHAVRVAFLTSLVAAATGAVLYGLVGLSAWIVVPLLVFGGWVVGCHLPPARPGHLVPGPGTSRPVRLADVVDGVDWTRRSGVTVGPDRSDDLAA